MTPINDERLHDAWRADAAELAVLPVAEIKARAASFDKVIARRNRREYVAGGIAAIVFAAYLFILPGWMLKLGSALIIAGVIFILWQLSRRSSQPDPQAATADIRSFYRRRLETEAAMLDGIGRWYLAPLLPGMGLFMAGQAWTTRGGGWIAFLVSVGLVVLIFAVIWRINRRAAAVLRDQIDRLGLN